jgi:hypothetical protein
MAKLRGLEMDALSGASGVDLSAITDETLAAIIAGKHPPTIVARSED